MSKRLYFALVMLLSGLSAWFPLAPFADFWAHAAVGRWIAANGRIPQETLFLWSSSEPWVAHSWLSQLVFYLTMNSGGESLGPLLVLILTMLLVMATFGVLWFAWARRARVTILTPLIFALAITGSYKRFGTRPELFTALFLACLFALLISWTRPQPGGEGEKTRSNSCLPAALVVVMFALWANFHGAVVVGLTVLVASVVFDAIQDRFSTQSRRLAFVAVLCAVAACVNPYGLRYWTALRSVQSYTFTLLEEWKPPFASNLLSPEIISYSALLLVVALAAWGMNPQRRWSHLVWLLITGALFLQAIRNLWLLNLASLAVITANAHLLDTRRLWHEFQLQREGPLEVDPPPRRGKKPRAEEHAVAVQPALYEVPEKVLHVGRLVLVCCFLMWIGIKLSEVWPLRPLSRHLPIAKTTFIRERNLAGRAFNSIEDSPYLEWQATGKLPLFIDILNAYPDRVTRDYVDIMQASARGQALLKEQNVKYILFAPQGTQQDAPPLLLYLEDQQPRWKLIYTAPDGMIWERQS